MNNNINILKIIDVTEISTSRELQEKIAKELKFPEFYGMNWDAFWDTITGLVELPERLIIKGWKNLVIVLPDDAKVMKELFEKYNKNFPMYKCDVEYT